MAIQCEIIKQLPKTVEEIDFRAVILRVYAANIFDLDAAADFGLFLKTMINGGIMKIMIDMEGLEFIDSAGISIIVNAAKMVRNNKGDIALLNVPERIEKIFKPIHLHRFLNIFSSESDALKFFKVFV